DQGTLADRVVRNLRNALQRVDIETGRYRCKARQAQRHCNRRSHEQQGQKDGNEHDVRGDHRAPLSSCHQANRMRPMMRTDRRGIQTVYLQVGMPRPADNSSNRYSSQASQPPYQAMSPNITSEANRAKALQNRRHLRPLSAKNATRMWLLRAMPIEAPTNVSSTVRNVEYSSVNAKE